MTGYDDRWYPLPENDPLVYNALAPGSYELEIKVLTGFGPDDYRVSRTSVMVQPPWYRTTVAYILAYALVAALLYLLYRQRLAVLRRRDKLDRLVLEEQLKALRAQINPHFLQNTFSFLSRSLVTQPVATAQATVQKLSSYLGHVLAGGHEQVLSLQEELIQADEYLAVNGMLFGETFSYSVDAVADVDTAAIEVPAMLLQPILENALKHGIRYNQSGEVRLRVYRQGRQVLCEIRNSIPEGSGLRQAATTNIPRGLALTEQRLRIMYNIPKEKIVLRQHVADGFYVITVHVPLK